MWGDLGCVVTTRFTIVGDRLTFESVSTTGCDADERIAMDAFFNFKPYTFDPGSPYFPQIGADKPASWMVG